MGTTLKKTCDLGNNFCQFDLEMTFKLPLDGTPVTTPPHVKLYNPINYQYFVMGAQLMLYNAA